MCYYTFQAVLSIQLGGVILGCYAKEFIQTKSLCQNGLITLICFATQFIRFQLNKKVVIFLDAMQQNL